MPRSHPLSSVMKQATRSPHAAVYVQFLLNRWRGDASAGITLVEILVGIILVLILAAFSLPLFLCQAPRAMQTQARIHVTNVNRGQMAFYLEQKRLSPTFAPLGVPAPSGTTLYHYTMRTTATAAFVYATARPDAYTVEAIGPFQWHKRSDRPLQSYVGAVFLISNPKTKQLEVTAITCQTRNPSTTQAPNPMLKMGKPTCATGTKEH